MGNPRKNNKSKKEIQEILEKRFSYLPKDERNKLICGKEFVKVPRQELERLRVNVYPYLM
ncbi:MULTISPECIES: hypothetical protein [Butyricimonas]|uniref:hypothetical protein n=1 Tax=Butyricimonas TaxID=574697 RepID=UPI0007FB2693|nr:MULTISPECIES: hypothetical protein [Butyricimonas]